MEMNIYRITKSSNNLELTTQCNGQESIPDDDGHFARGATALLY